MKAPITKKQLGDSVSTLSKKIAKKQAELARITEEIKRDEVRLELYSGLLALEEGGNNHRVEKVSGPGRFVQECERILGKAGEPMHVNNIHEALLKAKVRIPGKGNLANVIARIQRSDTMHRTGKGIYALVEWGNEEVKPTRKKRVVGKKK